MLRDCDDDLTWLISSKVADSDFHRIGLYSILHQSDTIHRCLSRSVARVSSMYVSSLVKNTELHIYKITRSCHR